MTFAKLRPAGNYWLGALLLLWAALLFGGFAFGSAEVEGGERIPTPARVGSSLVLVVAAWSWFAFTFGTPYRNYCLLIAVGMTFGFAGDLFMAGLIPVGDRVPGGMASFGCGHVAYLAAMIHLGRQMRLPTSAARMLAWLAWLIVGVVGWFLIVYHTEHPAVLRWAALGYVLLLASTAGCSTGLALQSRACLLLAGGAGLFFISDLILAAELFAGYRPPLTGSAVWLTYGPGQMLIVYAAAALPGLLGTTSARADTEDRPLVMAGPGAGSGGPV